MQAITALSPTAPDTMSAFLTVRQVADALQLAPKSVYRLLRRGLTFYRLGRAVRIARADLDAYLAGQRAGLRVRPG